MRITSARTQGTGYARKYKRRAPNILSMKSIATLLDLPPRSLNRKHTPDQTRWPWDHPLCRGCRQQGCLWQSTAFHSSAATTAQHCHSQSFQVDRNFVRATKATSAENLVRRSAIVSRFIPPRKRTCSVQFTSLLSNNARLSAQSHQQKSLYPSCVLFCHWKHK